MRTFKAARKKNVNFFAIGIIGLLLIISGCLVFSTRVFAGIGEPFYEIPAKHRSDGSIIVRLDNEVYPLEIVPSVAGLLLSTIGFFTETMKSLKVISRFPRLQIAARNPSNFRLCLSLLLSSWSIFFLWMRAVLL